MPRPAPLHNLLNRGVWLAPWCGSEGEMVLLAITSRHRLAVPPVVIPNGASRVDAANLLWDQLEQSDPEPPSARLRVI